MVLLLSTQSFRCCMVSLGIVLLILPMPAQCTACRQCSGPAGVQLDGANAMVLKAPPKCSKSSTIYGNPIPLRDPVSWPMMMLAIFFITSSPRILTAHAPTNGSLPDLISVKVDNNGLTHTTQAFNTETAEQLNAWLNGFKAQLCQMSDINYKFSVHVLMLLYKELEGPVSC
ncbi:hypothetical protein B0H10DRAFT_1961359 [Mycena sp. CBHHK59/15]|nr:hypothetical protein B0H10DRAFT_1961359 [Mycena sp. CBHHK59/15]